MPPSVWYVKMVCIPAAGWLNPELQRVSVVWRPAKSHIIQCHNRCTWYCNIKYYTQHDECTVYFGAMFPPTWWTYWTYDFDDHLLWMPNPLSSTHTQWVKEIEIVYLERSYICGYSTTSTYINWQILWNLRITDTLGAGILSFIGRLSLLRDWLASHAPQSQGWIY